MSAELLKIIVQAVVLERDEEGRITGEQMSPPTVLYTPDHLSEYVSKLQEDIDAANLAESANGQVALEGVPASDP
jgi:hypothetical protein